MPFTNPIYSHRFQDHVVAIDNDSEDVPVPVDLLPQTITFNGSNINTISVTYNGVTYVKTHTYTGGNLTGVSGWVAQ